MLRYFVIHASVLAALLAAAPAYAGCSSPSGNEADRIYNQASHVWQFCNGSNWMAFGTGNVSGGGGGGCSNPSGNEADQIYNQAYHVWQFCNGTNWATFSVNLVAGGGGSGCSGPTGNEADQIYNAQFHDWQFCNGTQWVAVGSPTFGPGDIVPGASVWYGLRAYNAAIAIAGTQALVNVRQSSNSHTCDIIVSSSGGLGNTANCSSSGDNGEAAATFCGSTCYVTEAYNQTGNGFNATQGTATQQPQLVFNCIGSLPCMNFVGSSSQQLWAHPAPSTIPQPVSISAVFNIGAASLGRAIGCNGTNCPSLGSSATTNDCEMGGNGGGQILATCTQGTWNSVQGIANGSSSVLVVNNSATTGTQSGEWVGSYLGIGSQFSDDYFTGYWAQAGIWPGAFTATQYGSLCHNDYVYWGTSTSC